MDPGKKGKGVSLGVCCDSGEGGVEWRGACYGDMGG